jgi:type VI secretion system secreted protein VgrG
MSTLSTETPSVYTLATALGPDLRFESFTMREDLGRLFEMHIQASSTKPDLDALKVLGQLATVSMELPTGSLRHFNGHVVSFSQASHHGSGSRYTYELEVRPWLWLLTAQADCRIFQNKTTTEIIKDVFADYGDASVKWSVQDPVQTWDFCVQYRETDFNFISRLLEAEGIFYYFEHKDKNHTLVLTDHSAALEPCTGPATVDYNPSHRQGLDAEAISSWHSSHQVVPGSVILRDFNFETPADTLEANTAQPLSHAWAKGRHFDYPGEYNKQADGTRLSRVRLEELQTPHHTVHGSGNIRSLACGRTFKLQGHPKADQNTRWALISTQIHGSDPTAESGAAAGGPSFQASFKAIPAQRNFRPARITPKPTIAGPQTAVVDGPAGEEIHTDKHGRIKLHFHWDRLGKAKGEDSYWVRVAQVWAGNAYGALSLPRIGQEVIVEFEEGDPDHPLVTGTVYNGTHLPAFPLPAEKTKWGFKSRSSKGGAASNFNEFSFEDKKGSEEVYLHAEKDQTLYTKQKRAEFVGGESHLKVEKDSFGKFGADVHTDIKGDDLQKIGGGVHLTVTDGWEAKLGTKLAANAGQEIHLKAGMKVVIEAGTQLTLKVGGNFIDINPGGVFIKGTMVMVNSGGSAGSGSGAAPKTPKAAAKARDSKGGTDKAAQAKPQKRPVTPKVAALQSARRSSVPFCEICEG